MATASGVTPPEAVDTEKVLLGTILFDSDQMLSVLEILPPTSGSWFYHESNRLIFDAMVTLTERGDPIDLQTVSDILRRRGHIEKIGGSVYLAELMDMVVTTANVTHHARIIKQKSLYRTLINISTMINASAYAQEDLTDILNTAHTGLMQVSNTTSTPAFSALSDLLTETIHIAEHADQRDLTGIPTGFHELDRLTSGFQQGNLIILAARPSQGKSALAMQFALAAARGGNRLPVAIFSLEMSKEELSARVLCSEARIDSTSMKRGFLGREEWGLIMNTAERLRDLRVLIDDTSALSVLDVRTRAKRLQMEHGLGMIVIDYLQLMSSSRRKENRQQEVSDISRDLKQLAKEFNIPVIALSQLNRDVERKNPPIPALADLRDSGAIEQDADVVMFIYRGDIYERADGGVAKIMVAKQRNGPTGNVELVFSPTFARFDELAAAHEQRRRIVGDA